MPFATNDQQESLDLPAARRLRRVQRDRLGVRKAPDDDLSARLSRSRDAV